MTAIAVLVGLAFIGLVLDHGLTQLGRYAHKIVLLLSRDVAERTEERVVRLEREERESRERLGR